MLTAGSAGCPPEHERYSCGCVWVEEFVAKRRKVKSVPEAEQHQHFRQPARAGAPNATKASHRRQRRDGKDESRTNRKSGGREAADRIIEVTAPCARDRTQDGINAVAITIRMTAKPRM